ncbi:hypothetical protein QZH41_003965 [Actinostola sp. cb2023]|nr:hypothetical protein QZH41_003965 [Actinostola sp. cb2023]
MSHGSEKGILTADRHYIQVDDIIAMFSGDKCQSLATKPKLFFVQACRGDVDDQGYSLVRRGALDVIADSDPEVDCEVPVKLPSDTDFLVAYSTTKGKSAYRQHSDDRRWMEANMASMGSWFIACLVQVVLEYSHQEDLLTMLTRVNKAMSELYTVEGFKQVSCYLSMLTKKVVFPTIVKDSKNAMPNEPDSDGQLSWE